VIRGGRLLTIVPAFASFVAIFTKQREAHSRMPIKGKTDLLGIILAVACSIVTGTSHLGLKWTADQVNSAGALSLRIATFILLFYFLYAVGFVFYLLALRRGELSTVYPVLAVRYVWVIALSVLLFPADSLNALKVSGAVLAAAGVVLVARGGH